MRLTPLLLARARRLADPLVPLCLAALFFKSEAVVSMLASVGVTGLSWSLVHTWGPRLSVHLALCALFVVPWLLAPGRWRAWPLLGAHAGLSLLLLADVLYYRACGSLLGPHALLAAGALADVPHAALSLVRPQDLVFVADLPVLWAVARLSRNLRRGLGPAPVAALLGVALAAGHVYWWHHRVDVQQRRPGDYLFAKTFAPYERVAKQSPLGLHAFDLHHFLVESRRLELTGEQAAAIEGWFDGNQEQAEPHPLEGSLAGRNVLIVQVESLERFVVGRSIDGQEICPRLNALVKAGLFFSNVHEQVNGGTSSDADLMVNTSVLPVRDGATFLRFPDAHFPASLPRLLSTRGYSTLAAHPERGGLWNWRLGLQHVGYERLRDESTWVMDERIGVGLSDASYVRQLLPVLTALPEPFLAFTVTLSSHGPFDLPDRLRTLRLPAELERTRLGGYFQSIAYVDRQLGVLLDGLAAAGRLERTVVVVLGDHAGPNKYYRAELAEVREPSWWRDEAQRVPLVIWAKGLPTREIDTVGGQVDVLPTLLPLLGVPREAYARSVMGRDLLTTRRAWVATPRGVIGDPAWSAHGQASLEVADQILRSDYFRRRATR